MNRINTFMENAQKQTEGKKEELIEITYYTDPLCCWSWVFEPQWRRLRYDFSGKIKWRYRMAGMLPSWDSYDDPINSVNRPLQMGPVWLEAKHISGMPINDKVWFHNPPASSFPACVAVKCAGLQSPEAEEWYLRRTREAIMLQGKDISTQEVLLSIAKKLTEDKPHILDPDQFRTDLETGKGNEAFRQDLEKTRYHQISRYPTLTIQKPGQAGVMITGYRPYDILLQAFQQLAPDLKPNQKNPDTTAYKAFWSGLTERELQEVK